MHKNHPPHSPWWYWLLIWLAAAVLLSSFLRTLWQFSHSRDRVEQERQAVEALEAQTRALELEVQEATSSFTLEKRAREELKLQQPDEVVIPVE